ncbi:MAG: alpha/beta hydrolase [Mariniblastus sp.]|nr:alpha/beta hydrolase [Mariniblastus sp.]
MNITSLKLQTWILSSLLTGVFCLVSPSVFAEDYPAKENKLENVKSAFTLSGYEAGNSVNETRWNSEITQGEDGEGQWVETIDTRGRTRMIQVCPRDDVWLISARDSHCRPCDASLLECSRLVNGCWQIEDLENLTNDHANDKTKVTMIYVHGNRTDLRWAKSRAMQFYDNSLRSCERPALRFIVFAWKSEAEKIRPIPDYKIKSNRSVTVGKAFYELLNHFEDRKMFLGGFSLGAQVVLSAMSEAEMQSAASKVGKYQVAFISPAINSEFSKASLAIYPQNSLVGHTDVFVSRDDCVVKVSEAITRRTNDSCFSIADLVGYQGGDSISVHDITCEVTRHHSIDNYGRSPAVISRVCESLNEVFNDGQAVSGSSETSE